jgi:AraC family 4-hydroxyphenylacetate 3-monooxygenase operon regulatory protein
MTNKDTPSNEIPNINVGKLYDKHYNDEDLHYESLDKLADFFGSNMPVHYHDRFYQLHVILNGNVRVHLDEMSFNAKGPMFFLTPPTVPHSFILDNNAQGHVITIRQQLIWQVLGGIDQHNWSGFMNKPLCVELHSLDINSNATAERLLVLLQMLADENEAQTALLHNRAMHSILQLIFAHISRLADTGQVQQKMPKEDIRIFHQFNELIEENYKAHLSLSNYAEKIGVTAARLNSVCQRLSGLPSKRLIMDRIMQEAQRLLKFSSVSVTQIGYELGFKDPAYFARFFRRNAQITASEYREYKHIEQ